MLRKIILYIKVYFQRKKMHKAYNRAKCLTNPEVIQESQKLDKLLNQINVFHSRKIGVRDVAEVRNVAELKELKKLKKAAEVRDKNPKIKLTYQSDFINNK